LRHITFRLLPMFKIKFFSFPSIFSSIKIIHPWTHGKIFLHISKYFVIHVKKYPLNILSTWTKYSKTFGLAHVLMLVATPILRESEEEDSHFQHGNLRVRRDSQNFKEWLQGSKHIALESSLYLGKLLKCRCVKWACMTHFDICSTSYGKKKVRESNCQFDSQPQKVGNRPDPYAFWWGAIDRWRALDENYNFVLDPIPIAGISKEL
jgi:hypothetical protein